MPQADLQAESGAHSQADRAPRWSGRRLAILGVAVLLTAAAAVTAVALAVGPDRPGWRWAVAFAALACLPGSLVAWIVTRLPVAAPAIAVAAPLAAITLRIMPPLAALAWLSAPQNGPVDAGAAPLLVAFYLALLATDILLHIMVRQSSQGEEKRPH